MGEKVIYVALQFLNERGGEAPNREVIAAVERGVTLDDWAKETFERSGAVRWQTILNFESIHCVRAGFLIREEGVWRLTPKGREALQLGEVNLRKAAIEAYQKWKSGRSSTKS